MGSEEKLDLALADAIAAARGHSNPPPRATPPPVVTRHRHVLLWLVAGVLALPASVIIAIGTGIATGSMQVGIAVLCGLLALATLAALVL